MPKAIVSDHTRFPLISEINAEDLSLECKLTASLDVESYDAFFSQISGRLVIYDRDYHEKKRCIGKVEAFVLHRDQICEQRKDLFHVLDTIDDNVVKYYEAIYDGDEVRDWVSENVEPGFGLNLLVIDKVIVHPTYRGRNLGLVLTRKMIDCFGASCEYVALRPFPLQHSIGYKERNYEELKKNHLADFGKSERANFSKVRKHWSRLGFALIPGTDVSLLSMATILPTAEELLLER